MSARVCLSRATTGRGANRTIEKCGTTTTHEAARIDTVFTGGAIFSKVGEKRERRYSISQTKAVSDRNFPRGQGRFFTQNGSEYYSLVYSGVFWCVLSSKYSIFRENTPYFRPSVNILVFQLYSGQLALAFGEAGAQPEQRLPQSRL